MTECIFEAPSPMGTIVFHLSDRGALTRLSFAGVSGASTAASAPISHEAVRVLEQLEAYFAGALRTFDLPIEPEGTPFQTAVWRELQRIPFGKTSTYGEIAARMELTNGQRAVGLANRANPIAIVIPCHRVIGADGALTGYAGGLEIKRALLHLEGSLPPETGRLF